MRKRRKESGIALLISIFVLLLISVVAIALIVSSGTESALAGNYRSSTGVYYAAIAGLEEVRTRLRSQDPNSFRNTDPGFLPTGASLAVCTPVYVTNPVGGENVTPWDPANPYYDGQFNQEFATICPSPLPPNPSPSALSIWNRSPLNGLPFPGPLYKWVRINGVSEKSLNLDVGPTYDGFKDPVTPVYYDGAQLNDQTIGKQVLEVTALAVLPNGSQKVVQYLLAPSPIQLPPFVAALTLAGSVAHGVAFSPPTSSAYYVSGVDLTTVPGCTAGPSVTAIGVLNGSDRTPVINGIQPAANQTYYSGSGSGPDVVDVSGSFGSLQMPSQFEALAKSIIDNADVIITPTGGSSAHGSDLNSLGMTSSNPMTVVIQGDLDLNAWNNTGYGLLLVTGNLNYDPDASWQGIVMVIGKGMVTGTKGGSGEFDGAFIVARTRDASGNLYPDPYLQTSSILFAPGMGGVGMRYSSCWIQKAIPSGSYKILSFHEISQ